MLTAYTPNLALCIDGAVSLAVASTSGAVSVSVASSLLVVALQSMRKKNRHMQHAASPAGTMATVALSTS